MGYSGDVCIKTAACQKKRLRLRSSRKETLKKDEAEASTSHDASASSSMDISDSREGRRKRRRLWPLQNHVRNVVLPPTAGDSGGDDTDQEYLPDDPEDEFDPAGVKLTATLSRKEKRALPRWKKTENLHRIFPVEQIQRNENFQKNCFYDTVRSVVQKCNNKAFTVSPQEIRQFIGVILLSGYNCQPEAKHYYWSTQPDMDAQGAISCISSSRFMEIKKYLYLADNQKLVKDDKMSKLCTNCSTPALSSMIRPYRSNGADTVMLPDKQLMKQKRGAFDCFVEEKPLSHLDFRRQVVLSLLQTERTATPRAASGSMSQLFDIRFLVFIL
ncbi:PiggyBac transposable element-derived protein 2 [Trichinella pseudospiralis]|uniref:PiggyBac transposable element-derived protein 2 n=1 Tax=Trichinella pseudospiralis TaxID=6337 RepID=A0A0V1F0I3_TRIPS|nr:PiggyBac transposable element-derived protein 2 [Trichinella pseudospiralis]